MNYNDVIGPSPIKKKLVVSQLTLVTASTMDTCIEKFPPSEQIIATEDILNAEDQQKPTPEGAGKNIGFVIDPSKLIKPKPEAPLLNSDPKESDDTNHFVRNTFSTLPGLSPRAVNGDIIIEDMTKPTCRWPFREGEHFEILQELGRGKYGICYLCEEKEQRQLFCAKKVKIYPGQSTEDIEREARIMGSLWHENIVPLYGATIDAVHGQRYCYLFMKYISGGTLASCGDIDITLLYGITRQIFSCIEYCHRRGITHGDIKSDNILLDQNIYITDFGRAQYKESSEHRFKEKCWSDVTRVGTVVHDLLKVETGTSTYRVLKNKGANSQYIDIICDINNKGVKRYSSSSLLKRINEIN